MTELHQAAAAGDFKKVQELLTQPGCAPNLRDADWGNTTALHWAAREGHTETVRLLIQHGARASLRTRDGWTPAHCAAEFGRLSVLRLLHSLHAPIDQEDRSGDRPLRIAQVYGHQDCVSFLRTAELECQAHREKAAQLGLSLDDTDEEWAEHRGEVGGAQMRSGRSTEEKRAEHRGEAGGAEMRSGRSTNEKWAEHR